MSGRVDSFLQLVDFVCLYGHRKDVGICQIAGEFDLIAGDFLMLSNSDMLIITADHGMDPDPRWATTDHSGSTCYFGLFACSGAGVPWDADTLAEWGDNRGEFRRDDSARQEFLDEMKMQRPRGGGIGKRQYRRAATAGIMSCWERLSLLTFRTNRSRSTTS